MPSNVRDQDGNEVELVRVGEISDLSADIVAALEAADSPSGENPFATGIYHARKHLSAADIIANTQFELVADPGSGKAIVVVAGFFQFYAGTVAFDAFDAAPYIGLAPYSDYPFKLAIADLSEQIVGAIAPSYVFTPFTPLNTYWDGDGRIYLETLSPAPTIGNGTIDIDLWYAIVDTQL